VVGYFDRRLVHFLRHTSPAKADPRAQRLLTDMTDTQRRLYDLFDLDRYAATR
jgi:hypothetical protein